MALQSFKKNWTKLFEIFLIFEFSEMNGLVIFIFSHQEFVWKITWIYRNNISIVGEIIEFWNLKYLKWLSIWFCTIELILLFEYYNLLYVTCYKFQIVNSFI